MVNPAPTQQPLGGRDTGAFAPGPQSGRQSNALVFIGAGPRALMLLERLLAHRDPATQLAVHLDRGVNTDGLRLDPQRHMSPILGTGSPADADVLGHLAGLAASITRS